MKTVEKKQSTFSQIHKSHFNTLNHLTPSILSYEPTEVGIGPPQADIFLNILGIHKVGALQKLIIPGSKPCISDWIFEKMSTFFFYMKIYMKILFDCFSGSLTVEFYIRLSFFK